MRCHQTSNEAMKAPMPVIPLFHVGLRQFQRVNIGLEQKGYEQ
jgi:hypothetical protein